MSWLLILLALFAGSMLPLQAGINAELKRNVGDPTLAALISFGVGTVALLFYVVMMRVPIPSASVLQIAPAWAWFGGVCGAIYIALIIFLTPKLGVGTAIGLIVTGQMLMALLLDHFGAVGLAVHPVSAWRAAGAFLLILGVVLIQKF